MRIGHRGAWTGLAAIVALAAAGLALHGSGDRADGGEHSVTVAFGKPTPEAFAASPNVTVDRIAKHPVIADLFADLHSTTRSSVHRVMPHDEAVQVVAAFAADVGWSGSERIAGVRLNDTHYVVGVSYVGP